MASRSAVQCSRGAEGDGVTRAEVGKEELMQQQHSLHLVEQWSVLEYQLFNFTYVTRAEVEGKQQLHFLHLWSSGKLGIESWLAISTKVCTL